TMLATSEPNQNLIRLNSTTSPLFGSNHVSILSQFTSWARIWMASVHVANSVPHKTKVEPFCSDKERTESRSLECISDEQLAHLYRITCHKLTRPHKHMDHATKLNKLGDIIAVRAFWDNLERAVYQEISATSNYVPPSKRIPLHPDKPGSFFLPKRSKRYIVNRVHNSLFLPKRKSFESTTIVYTLTTESRVQLLPVKFNIQEEDADDNVPLGALLLAKPK
ncbi:hypothetical protein CU098_008609, partial [Rhizopus stolonifer]